MEKTGEEGRIIYSEHGMNERRTRRKRQRD